MSNFEGLNFPARLGYAFGGLTAIRKRLGEMYDFIGRDHIDVVLTHAQILTLRATPVNLVPAPGAGKANVFDEAIFVLDVTTTGYTETADNLTLEYADGTDIVASVETTGFLDQTTDQVRRVPNPVTATTPAANSAIRLVNSGDGEFGAGNAANKLCVRIYYHEIPTTAFVASS